MSLHGVLSAAAVLSAALFLGAVRAEAKEWHVSPRGTPQGDGSAARPWDLATALAHPPAVKPGDVIWLHGGTYAGAGRDTFVARLAGEPERPIIVRQAPGERAVIQPTFGVAGGAHAWYWGVEIENPDTKEYEPYDHGRLGAVWLRGGDHVKLINLVIHGGGQGIGAWVDCTNLEVYGCIVFHNGWAGSNQGHGIYTQNNTGTKVLADNIFFHQLGNGYGVHAYGSERAFIKNFHLVGNVAFGNRGNNILIGGGSPSENILLENNFVYGDGGFRFGYTAHNRNGVVRDNYLATRCSVHNWDELVFAGNTVVNPTREFLLDATKLEALPKYEWDRNAYLGAKVAGNFFQLRVGQASEALPFEEWRRRTGFDATSRADATPPKDVFVAVRPNRYDPDRAHVVVFNWAGQATVEADLGGFLKPGDAFEVRDVQNLFGEPVAAGVYRGGPLSLPMDLTEVMQPVTRERFQHTPPEFNVFLLLRKPH